MHSIILPVTSVYPPLNPNTTWLLVMALILSPWHMLFFSVVVLFGGQHYSRWRNTLQQGTNKDKSHPNALFWHPTSFKTTQLLSTLWETRVLATKQVPPQRPNIQINLSQVLCLPPSSEWPTSPHLGDLSALWNKRLYQTPRCTLPVCADLMFDKAREQRRGNISHVQNESEFLLPYFQQSVLLKGSKKKTQKKPCDPARKKKK